MRGCSPRTRGNGGWIAKDIAVDQAAEAYAELGFPQRVGSEIKSCRLFYDRQGKLRRVRFIMTDGWTHQANTKGDGRFSLHSQWDMSFSTKPRGAA